jgi:hypothetical protein
MFHIFVNFILLLYYLSKFTKTLLFPIPARISQLDVPQKIHQTLIKCRFDGLVTVLVFINRWEICEVYVKSCSQLVVSQLEDQDAKKEMAMGGHFFHHLKFDLSLMIFSHFELAYGFIKNFRYIAKLLCIIGKLFNT